MPQEIWPNTPDGARVVKIVCDWTHWAHSYRATCEIICKAHDYLRRMGWHVIPQLLLGQGRYPQRWLVSKPGEVDRTILFNDATEMDALIHGVLALYNEPPPSWNARPHPIPLLPETYLALRKVATTLRKAADTVDDVWKSGCTVEDA